MTPYQKLQLGYLIVAGLACAGVWWLSARRPAVERRPWARFSTASLALGLPLAGGVGLVKVVDDPHSTYQFAFIALAFYAAGLWLPLLLVVDAARRWRRGLPLEAALLVVALVLPALAAWSLLIEPNRLVTSEATLELAGWSKEAPPLRVVHVSDLQSVGACERERRAVELINALEPDLIVVTGDYAAGPFDDPTPGVEAARAFLGALRARHGVVCVAGHSESESLRQRIFKGLDVTYLRNEELELDLSEGGVERRLRLLAVTALGPDFAGFVAREEPGLVTLAVSHEPDVSPRFDGLGVALHLAGHTHGGQVCLPLLGPPLTLSTLPRRYARGLNRLGDHWLHVSPGIGMEGNHAPRVRFLCPPSVDLLVLHGADGEAPKGP